MFTQFNMPEIYFDYMSRFYTPSDQHLSASLIDAQPSFDSIDFLSNLTDKRLSMDFPWFNQI